MNTRRWPAIPAILAIGFALWKLHAAAGGVTVEATPFRRHASAYLPAGGTGGAVTGGGHRPWLCRLAAPDADLRTLAGAQWLCRGHLRLPGSWPSSTTADRTRTRWPAFGLATLAVIAFGFIGLSWPLDAYGTPAGGRNRQRARFRLGSGSCLPSGRRADRLLVESPSLNSALGLHEIGDQIKGSEVRMPLAA
jgi:hypothetical protein